MSTLIADRRRRWIGHNIPIIDREHPLSVGLVCCLVGRGGTFIDIAGNIILPATGSPINEATEFGPATACLALTDHFEVTVGSSNLLSLQPPVSLAMVGESRGTTGRDDVIFGVSYSQPFSSPYVAYVIGTGSAADGTTIQTNNGAGTQINLEVADGHQVGSHILVGTITPAATTLFVDGKLGVTGTGTSTISYTGTSSLHLGGVGDDTVNWVTTAAYIWSRELTDNDIAAFNDDPFCMMQKAINPGNVYIPFVAGGAPPTTVFYWGMRIK